MNVLCLVAQLHLTCSPVDCSLPGSFVHEIFQARILEWGTVSYSRGSSQSRDGTRVSVVSCIVRQILYHWEAPDFMNNIGNMTRTDYQNEKWPFNIFLVSLKTKGSLSFQLCGILSETNSKIYLRTVIVNCCSKINTIILNKSTKKHEVLWKPTP